MKKYILTLTVKSNKSIAPRVDTIADIFNIESDDILSLIAQFNVTIAMIQKKYYEEELSNLRRMNEDDVPF